MAAKVGQTRLIDNMEEMSSSDMVLFAVMAVMGINHLTLRLPGWDKRLWLFWLTRTLQPGHGLPPDLERHPRLQGDLSIVNYMIALLFIYHILVNNRRLSQAQSIKDDRPRLSTMKKSDDEDDLDQCCI